MKSLEKHLEEMHKRLDEVIQVAEHLRDVSKQVISKEELAPLQKRQDALLKQIEELDQKLQKDYAKELTEPMHQALKRKFKVFQELNEVFIENIRSSHELIQFELRRLKEEENS